MKQQFDWIRLQLDLIQADIAASVFKQYQRTPAIIGWGGADVIFVKSLPFRQSLEVDFYPEPRTVVTMHAHEVGWLMDKLRDAFIDILDGCTKIEFFGRLAKAALQYQEGLQKEDESAVPLLESILAESRRMLDEIEHGEFEYLQVAFGRTIAADARES